MIASEVAVVADPFALDEVGVQRFRVVRQFGERGRLDVFVFHEVRAHHAFVLFVGFGVGTGHRGDRLQRHRRVGDGPHDRAGGVLGGVDRGDPVAGDEAQRRAQADVALRVEGLMIEPEVSVPIVSATSAAAAAAPEPDEEPLGPWRRRSR